MNKEFKILYGINNNVIDITNICYEKCMNDNIIFIPSCDIKRSKIFTDPSVNILKFISIYRNDIFIKKLEHDHIAFIDLNRNELFIDDFLGHKSIKIKEQLADFKLKKMHKKLILNHGSLNNEYPEQLMSVMFIEGNEKVLEIGSNIGRNTIIISTILNNCNNNDFVTLECSPESCGKLFENQIINNLDFKIEPSALSKRKLVQKFWETIPIEDGDIIPDGYKSVKTISFNELLVKYNINFDTLVLDCEGAFYYILIDMPEILDNINKILVENDYTDIKHKEYVDNILLNKGFICEYSKSLEEWSPLPCVSNFFEAWIKK